MFFILYKTHDFYLTISGIKVLMNDDEKNVTIIDQSGNTYFMDGNENISVTAPNESVCSNSNFILPSGVLF